MGGAWERELMDAYSRGYVLGQQQAREVIVAMVRQMHVENLERWKEVPVNQRDLRAVKRARASALAEVLRRLGADE